MASDPADRAGAILVIDLAGITANWRLLAQIVEPAICAAVVKADAYGLGAAQVSAALASAGCRLFFTATIEEGVALRGVLPEPFEIAVLNGALAGCAEAFIEYRLVPVLNDPGQIAEWQQIAVRQGELLAMLHLDTGMARLGLTMRDFDRLAGLLRKPSASSGIFLGPAFHYDFVRPGAALYGINPQPGGLNPMRQIVRLRGRILQVREVDRGESVGYGATHLMNAPGRLATVAVGYADGWPRSLCPRGSGRLGGKRVPLVGRVSMDLVVFDVSDVDPAIARPGGFIELLGDDYGVDAAATGAGTIGYEILTALGRRYHRVYRGAPDQC